LQINGNLTVNGMNYLNIKPSEEKPFAGEYPLVRWTGTLTGDSSKFTVMGLKGMSTALKIRNNTLFLVIKGQRAPQTGVVWAGAASATWDFNTDNFKIGEDATPFVNGDQLLFNDESSTKTITMTDYMSPASITVDNSLGDYTFKGETGISGTGGITKTGTSALILTTAKSDYTGATIVNGGTLEVYALADGGLASSIGAAGVVASNLMINNATLRVNNINTATNRGITLSGDATINIPLSNSFAVMKGTIVGTGKLIKTGVGQLSVTYSGPTTYSGGTVVKAGTLAMGTWNTSFGVFGSPLELQGTSAVTIFNNNVGDGSAKPVFNYALSIPTGSSVKIWGGQRCKVAGTLSGDGTLTFNVPYVRCDMTGNWSAFSGSLIVTGSQFRMCNANGLGKASVTLGDNVTYGHFTEGSATGLNLTSSIGSLAGSATSSLYSGTFNIGANNKSAIFSGIISAGVTVNKYGTGVWTLTNANLNSSTTTVFAGTLTVANTTGSATGTGTVLVKSGAILNGTGLIGGGVTLESGATLNGNPTISGVVTVRTGANLLPGTPGSALVKTMILKNSLTLQSQSNITMKVLGGVSATCDKLVMSGAFNPGGNLTVSRPSQLVITDGYTFPLFTAASIGTTRFDSISLPNIGTNMYWDTTTLYTNGTIVARNMTSLRETNTIGFKVSSTLVDKECQVQTGTFTGKASLQILDAKGVKLQETQVSSNTSINLNVSGFAPGIYFVRLKKEQGSDIQQFIKKSL
jgi:autotransporter-associated beta strand protein